MSASDDILAVAMAQNEAFLIAWRTGYEAGFDAACKAALKIMKQAPTDGLKGVKTS
jgi:hypothetical protein